MQMKNEQQWGRTQIMAPPWQAGEIRTLVERPCASLVQRIPKTQSLLLTGRAPVNQSESTGPVFAMRWVVTLGTGGADIRYVLDLGGTIRLCAPGEQLRVSVLCEAQPGVTFESPSRALSVAAILADGTVDGAGPTYTTYFSVAANGTSQLLPPAGAIGFRVLGIPGAADDPYTASTIYETGTPIATYEEYTGDFLLPIRYVPMPFNSQCQWLTINNAANGAAASGYIEWEIDL